MGTWEKEGVCMCVYAYAYFYMCAHVCVSESVSVCALHSKQHTLRLWQTDSKPRYPHTPLPRLIVHEIRTFGLQNACPPSMGNWVLWLPSLQQWLQWFELLRGNSMSVFGDVKDGLTRKPNVKHKHIRRLNSTWQTLHILYTHSGKHTMHMYTHATSTEKQTWKKKQNRHTLAQMHKLKHCTHGHEHMDTKGHK